MLMMEAQVWEKVERLKLLAVEYHKNVWIKQETLLFFFARVHLYWKERSIRRGFNATVRTQLKTYREKQKDNP